MNLSFLVIGCGSIGRRHIRNLLTLQVGTVTGCEPVPERARQVELDFGIHVHPTLRAALEDRPTASLVCSPPSLHLTHARAAIEAGSHLFIEKPIAHTLEGLDEFVEEVELRGIICMLGYNWRFHPSFRAMKQILDGGAIGEVLAARVVCGQYLPEWHPWEDYRSGYSARRELGGGVLLDSHELEYITWLLGDVEQIWCAAGKVSRLEIQTEDVADLVLKMRSGAQVNLHFDYLQRPAQRSYELVGSEGTLRWSLERGVSVYRVAVGGWEDVAEPQGFDLNFTYRDELAHFAACLRKEALPPVDARRGKMILELIVAARQSAETNMAAGAREANVMP